MTDQAEQAPVTYGVFRQQDGAQIVVQVDADTARGECARLNAEAGLVIGTVHEVVGIDAYGQPVVQDTGKPRYAGMYLGERVRYEVRSSDGLVVA